MAGGQGDTNTGRGWQVVHKARGKRKLNLSPTHQAAQIQAEQRMTRALAFKLAGLSNEAIGTELGISREGARKLLIRAMDRLREDNAAGAERLRSLEVARIDKALTYIHGQLLKGHLGAVQRLERLVDLKSRLLGLFPRPEDAPPPDPREFAAKVSAFLAETGEL